MGRHSAPEDDEPLEPSAAAVAVIDGGPAAGRHARPAEPLDRDDATTELPVVRDAGARPAAHIASVPVPAAPRTDGADATVAAPARGVHATRADASLVRSHPDVRNRVIAAAVLPFVLWAVVFAVRGGLGANVSLIWLTAPILIAGILVGVVLDLGHRRYPVHHPDGDAPARTDGDGAGR